jgi:hypothetical protein
MKKNAEALYKEFKRKKCKNKDCPNPAQDHGECIGCKLNKKPQ